MPWRNGHICVEHAREPWDDRRCREIIVHSKWDCLKGTSQDYSPRQRERFQNGYMSAKRTFNLSRAFEAVERCISEQAMDQLADVILDCDRTPMLVFPHLSFDGEHGTDQDPLRRQATNAIPFAFAAALGEKLGLPVNDTIFQSARVGRTKMPVLDRFLYQPTFEGAVEKRPYILLDDVATLGGTFAALRSYIIRSGGSVVAATALAHNFGVNQPLPIAGDTVDVLRSEYGPELDTYWMESFGHEPDKLTEAEGRFLVAQVGGGRRDQALQRLREKFDQTAAEGREQTRQESSG